jgi:hypothetical protein
MRKWVLKSGKERAREAVHGGTVWWEEQVKEKGTRRGKRTLVRTADRFFRARMMVGRVVLDMVMEDIVK